jgi:hypothetical protein
MAKYLETSHPVTRTGKTGLRTTIRCSTIPWLGGCERKHIIIYQQIWWKSEFQDSPKDKARELILIVEGGSSQTAEPLLNAWSSINPTFTIANPPSLKANKKLVGDLNQQSGQKGQNCPFEDAINPFDEGCWNGQSKVMHLDLGRMQVEYPRV